MLPEPLFLNIHMYGIMILEYLRGDNRGELIGLIIPSQFWSLLMILLGIILIFVIKNLYQRNGK
jgi:prolipoprotein diacylglyceryltransferase